MEIILYLAKVKIIVEIYIYIYIFETDIYIYIFVNFLSSICERNFNIARTGVLFPRK